MITPTEELCWRTRGAIIPEHQLDIDKQIIIDLESHYKSKGGCEGDFGNDAELMFPTRKYPSINNMAVHRELIAIAGQLLNGPPVLIQAVAWGKVAKDNTPMANNDQRMHMDYGNNSFVHPPPFSNPNVAACIVYLSDTAITGGGTSIVARRGHNDKWYKPPYIKMPGQAGIEFINDRETAEKELKKSYAINRDSLYAREEIPEYDIGDMLWYRHDVWHRGTPVKKGHTRYVVSLAWKKATATICIWNAGFAKQMYYGWLEKFIAKLNAYQLYSIGFPHPLDSYWCKETIEGTHARLSDHGFDLHKYLASSII